MKTKKIQNDNNSYEMASQYQLMWIKLKKHKMAMFGLIMLILLYLVLMFCEFLAPYNPNTRNSELIYAPPQRVRFIDQGKFQFRPFVYGYSTTRNPETLALEFVADSDKKYDLQFFCSGDKYSFWGLFNGSVHLFGTNEGYVHLFGTDGLGRDMLSRVSYGTRISLSVGLIGLVLTFILGLIMGGLSGYLGGFWDSVIQRMIEFIRSIPTLPLWMALAAALPSSWSPLRIYFGITIILSIIGWTGLARVVRGKLLSLREEDYVLAAKISGAPTATIIAKHMIPSFLSYIIVSLTMSIPGMILGETALSFIGLGLRAPVVSWGSLLYEARDIHAIARAPWLLLPALSIFITVLSFNFLGDGMRDAADPYKR